MELTLRRSLRYAGLTIEYDHRVLEPRPWTELQARWAAELAESAPSGRLLELCSGAGHIGLAAAALSGRSVVCVDLDPVACYFTGLNAEGAGLAEQVEVRRAPLGEALAPDERFALALADPPWVASDDLAAYPEDPRTAIDGGPGGLDLAHECVRSCRGHLAEGGSLLLQVGSIEQADAVAAVAASDGWRDAGRRRAPAAGDSGGGVVVRLLHP